MDFHSYLPKQECQFMNCVIDELETYRKDSSCKSVLLFPPLPSRLRYLIHSHIEDLPELTTFSVGEGWCRRVVVCHSDLRDDAEDVDFQTSSTLCPGPLTSRKDESNVKPKSSVLSRIRGPKRPDKPLYMPRAARERLSLDNPKGLSGDKELPGPGSSSFCHISTSSDSCSGLETTGNTTSSSTFRQEYLPNVTDCTQNHAVDRPVVCSQALKPNEAEAQVSDLTVSSFADMTLEDDEKDKEDLASVPCKEIAEEIRTHLKQPVTVSIEDVHNDYSAFVNVCININPEEFCHVIEIYNFPPIFKTDDLLDAFTEYSDGGIRINWVDDTHALGVFASESAAIHALSICHPMLKVRALVEGSKKAKAKAIRSAEFIQPVKERPRTDCAVAQRMVTRALGLQGRGKV